MFYYEHLPSKLHRYSEAKYTHRSLCLGEFLFRSADYYKKCEGDKARQDDEQIKKLTSQNENNYFIRESTGQLCKPLEGEFKYQTMLGNYFMSCFSTKWDEKLFKEFSTKDIKVDSCLVIHNVEEFISRLCTKCESMFPEWAGKAASVIYDGRGYHNDPVFYKPMSFNQQNEWRFACMPPPATHKFNNKEFFVHIGNIEKIAEIVSRSSHV
jgi:hypothetical protein